MMSLFSSFDFSMFFYSFFILSLFFSLNFLSSNFKSSFKFLIFQSFFLFMKDFFNSLSNSNFSKSFSFMLIWVMMFIFLLNFSSIFSYNFPLSSQMGPVMGFSVLIWLTINSFNVIKNMKSNISHFVPEGAPMILTPFLFVIEIISNFIRPITLSVRLVANVLAGHLLIILLSLLIQNFPVMFPFLSLLNLVELFVSLIQSYIFVTLVSLYFSEI